MAYAIGRHVPLRTKRAVNRAMARLAETGLLDRIDRRHRPQFRLH